MSYDHRTIEGFDRTEVEIIRDITSRMHAGENPDLRVVSQEYHIPSSQAVVYIAEASVRKSNGRRYDAIAGKEH